MKSKRLFGLFLIICGLAMALFGLLRKDSAIYVPTGETIPYYTSVQPVETTSPVVESYYVQSTATVNINTAGKEELMTLPGIGEVRAEAIIAYREQNGRFISSDELMNVSGIGEKTFEKLHSYIRTD